MIKIGRYEISYKNVQLFFILLYFQFLYAMNFTPPYQYLALLVAILQIVASVSKKGTAKLRFTTYIFYQIGFVFFLIVHTLLFSTYPEQSGSAIKTVCWNLFIFFFLVNYFDDVEDVEKLINGLIFCVIFADIFIIIYTRGNGANGRMAHGVSRPVWGNNVVPYVSMEFSTISVYATLFCMYFFKKTKKILYLLPIILFSAVVILCGSRKSLVFFVCGVVAYSFMLIEKHNIRGKMILFIASIGFVILVCVSVIKIPALYDVIGYRFVGYIEGMLTGEFTETSANTRENMKEAAIAMFKERPYVGYGIDTFRKYPGSYGTWSHNNYLELMVGCGIFALPIYYWYHLWILLKLRRHKSNNLVSLIMLIIIFVIVFDWITVSYMSRTDQTWLMIGSFLVWNFEQRRYEWRRNI